MKRFFLAFILFIATLVVVWTSSDYFVMNNYKNIEKKQNENHLKSFVQTIKNSINYVKNISTDYARWDDTYNFLDKKNDKYIYENFRNQADTLETLELDFMIFTKLDKSIYFKALNKQTILTKDFIKNLFKVRLSKNNDSGFIFHDKNIFIFHRQHVTNSDATKKANGYLYAGKVLTVSHLKDSNSYANNIKFKNFNYENLGDLTSKSYDLIYTTKKSKIDILNYIHLVNPLGQGISSISFEIPRQIYLQGKKTTHIFLAIISILLFMIILMFWLKEQYLKNENKRFEIKLKEKTAKLQETMQNLQSAIYQLEKIAYVDDLTGTHSRRSFFEKILKSLETAHKENRNVSFAMMDLDDFKTINDTYGHDTGDIVLQHFCKCCEKFLDDSMLLSRLGGEEFVIGFKNCKKEEATQYCRNIQHYIDENPVVISKNLIVSYTVSIGIADNICNSNIDKILKKADDRLYRAKTSGKNLIRMRDMD